MNETKQSAMRKLRGIMPARAVSLTEAYMLAERQATELLRLLDVRQVPVPVARLGELPRVEIQVEPRHRMLDKSGFSHRWENGRWLIVVNRNDVPGRRRFTLAHEFKHVLDHSVANVAYAHLSRGDAKRRDRQVEQICDHFAACLLMPRPVVKRAWTSGIQDIDALAGLFKVSNAAMQVRLDHLGLSDAQRPVATYFRRQTQAFNDSYLVGALDPRSSPSEPMGEQQLTNRGGERSMKQLNVQPAKRAVLYLRTRTVGGDDQMVDADLERQRAACQQVARQYGADVIHEYAAIGGTRDGHVRCIVSTMLTAVARDHVDYVITTGIDRLCRGPVRADQELLNSLRRNGARLLCPSTWDVLPPRLDIDDPAEAARPSRLRQAAVRRMS